MKRIGTVLLLLGLIAAFSMQAMAVDVKFSGTYEVTGIYLDKTTLNKNDVAGQSKNLSTAFYYQRLRLGTDFVISPSLVLVTRADIMERAWGAARSAPGVTTNWGLLPMSGGTDAENENIAFDWLYLKYDSPVGRFIVGYMDYGVWGTVFGDSSWIAPRLMYVVGKNGFAYMAAYVKGYEFSKTSKFASTFSDMDYDIYYPLIVKYTFQKGEVGLLTQFQRIATTRPTLNYKTEAYGVSPYAKLKLGPVYLQAEMAYAFGKYKKFEDPAVADDVTISNWSGWIDGTADFGKFYIGGSLAYVSGDDFSTTDKMEGGLLSGGYNWNPCLIMFNYDRTFWAGTLAGYDATTNGSAFANGYLTQLRAGIRPIEKLDIMASVSYATADKTPAAVWESREYGTEVDLIATYKITNNLSYMLGFGYWFVGNYYKGTTSTAHDLNSDYMVTNKLTLTF